MAKINRYSGNLKAFASNATGSNRTVFGDVTQADDLDSNVNSDFLLGWEIVSINEKPTKQDFNALSYTLGHLISYLHQMGVSEWHTSQEFAQYGFCIGSDGRLYQSVIAANIGNDPTTDDGTNWIDALLEMLDEDDMASNSDTKVASQQSIKAYVDTMVGVPSGETILFYKDTAVTGYTLNDTLDDKVVYITKGSVAGGETGGSLHSSGTWTKPVHAHTGPSHTHTGPSHDHGPGTLSFKLIKIGGVVSDRLQGSQVGTFAAADALSVDGGSGGSLNFEQAGRYTNTTESTGLSAASGTGATGAEGTGATGDARTANTWRPAACCFTMQTRN